VNYVVDDIGTVVSQMVVRAPLDVPAYLYGHQLDINNQLLRLQQDPLKKEQRYPLVALFLDIEEPVINGVINYKLNLVIVAKTNPNDSAVMRFEDTKVFKTILNPLYEAFFKSLGDSGLFMWPGVMERPKHSKFFRPFWGKPITEQLETKKNEANIFNDYLDAIQIKGLEINQKLKYC